MEKEAEMEYECSDCCIAFQDRKSHQAHMIEEHSDTAENPFFCQKCNVYLKVNIVDTVFPHIVSAETILFLLWPYVL